MRAVKSLGLLFPKKTILFQCKYMSSGLPKGYDILSDDETSKKVYIKGYGDNAFQINDYIVPNAVCLLPSSFFIWNCKQYSELTLEHLSLFTVVYPRIEILFIGCGETMPRLLDPKIVNHFRSKGIIVEPMSTKNAASTFNVLNGEGRNIAAALLTIKPLQYTEDEQLAIP